MLPHIQSAPNCAHRLFVRRDLHNNSVCGGALSIAPSMDPSFADMLSQLGAAMGRWQRIGRGTALHVALPITHLTLPEHAAHLDAALAGAGYGPQTLHLEIEESAFALGGGVQHALEKLRGRGWSLGLRAGLKPCVALDARTRTLFSTLVLEEHAPDSHAQRVDAAKAAGWMIILSRLPRDVAPARLIAEGYDAFEASLGPAATG